mgnify:CR=1 FL=1
MKWSIIRVGIVTLFMGLVTSVLGMTEDDRQQRRAERHQRKLQQYKSGSNAGQNGISVSCSNINPGGTV